MKHFPYDSRGEYFLSWSFLEPHVNFVDLSYNWEAILSSLLGFGAGANNCVIEVRWLLSYLFILLSSKFIPALEAEKSD
jgi:hypothetical protein